MTDAEIHALIRGLLPAVRELMARELAPVVVRLAALEATPPRDGRDGLPGRDGADGAPGPPGRDGADGAPGRDGLGLDQLETAYDGERTLQLTLRNLDRTQTATLTLPVPVYRGVWQRGVSYQRGDLVTFGGSVWHANVTAPAAKPGDGSTWTLAVKRGQDGKGA